MRILVTRPQPGADQTAERLVLLGYQPVVLPLSRIEAMPVAKQAVEFDAGVASSVNSIRHAPSFLLDALRGRPVHVVGEATAAAVRAARLEVGEIAAGAEDLAARLRETAAAGQRIAYLCGRVRLPIFQARMAAAGFDVHPFEVYDTLAASCPAADAEQRLKPGIDAVLLYSSFAAEAFVRLAAQKGIGRLVEEAQIFCLSGRIAAELAGWPRVHASSRPDEQAILNLVREKLP